MNDLAAYCMMVVTSQEIAVLCPKPSYMHRCYINYINPPVWASGLYIMENF